MKIGIDAYFLADKANTGIGNFVKNLVIKLSEIDKENEYYLYTPFVLDTKTAKLIEKNSNFKIKTIKSIFSKTRRFFLQSYNLLREIKKDKIEIFFAGGEYCPILLPKKIKVITVIHDLVFKIFPDTVSLINKISYKTLFPLSVKRSNIIATVSQNSANEIKKLLKPKQKIITIYNGIEIEKYIPKEKVEKKDYILFVGTLQPRKNLVSLLKAFSLIYDQIREKLVIIGKIGWKTKEMFEILNNNKYLMEKIDFKGYVDPETLIKYYQEAKILVVPSIHEGFCLPIAEAMASKTAVVASDIPTINEVFKGYVIKCDPYNPKDIGNKIKLLLEDPQKREELEEKGFDYIKNFKLERQAKEYLKLFNFILSE